MNRRFLTLTLWTAVFALLAGAFLVGQGWEEWEDSSPPIGKKIPDVKIYDVNLNHIPLSNLYKGSYLYFQWGGCT